MSWVLLIKTATTANIETKLKQTRRERSIDHVWIFSLTPSHQLSPLLDLSLDKLRFGLNIELFYSCAVIVRSCTQLILR